ncbi:MAG: hypothetical protein HY290_29000 [Planctomycetia bacterium]|nr:hypothetical protein [Planctomycetia bacterium]
MTDDSHHQLFDKDMPLLDAPAFVRRAREVEGAWTAILEVCARERARMLEMPRLRLARLFALSRPGEPLPAVLFAADAAEYLTALHAEWQPRLRSKVTPARSAAALVRAAADLRLSIERFNRRWLKKLNELDLARINALRDGYNRYYLLEKECALRSTRIAREGFQPLEPVTVEDLLEQFPLLRPV